MVCFCPPRRTDARKRALEVERQRAAKVASLPPPPPRPFEVRTHVYHNSDHNFRGTTYIYWSDSSPHPEDIQSWYLHTIGRVVQQKPRE